MPDVSQDQPPLEPDPDIKAKVFKAKAYTREELLELNFNPDKCPGLLKFEWPDGVIRFPAFQFAYLGGKRPQVRGMMSAIAERLGKIGRSDPWLIAYWWLDKNPWLEAVPADLLEGPGKPPGARQTLIWAVYQLTRNKRGKVRRSQHERARH